MNKAIAFIIVIAVLVLGYWSYNSSVISPEVDSATAPTTIVSGAEMEVDAIDLGDDSDASLQEIDNDLNSL